MPAQSNTRARWARFAARLGLTDLDAIDLSALRRFSQAELAEAVAAAGLEVGEAADAEALVARIRDERAHADPERRSRRRSTDAPAPEPTVKRAEPTSAPRKEAAVPWSYGLDRIRAMAVDPERLFVYWEVTDEAIEHARREMGENGRQAALVLRVYDITGRIFDGTNAHGHFDHAIGREDRQWFFDIGRPSSEACVELGLKGRQGAYGRICRSGRVEFPRRGAVSASSTQWLTVRAGNGGTQVDAVRDQAPNGDPPPADRAGGPGPGDHRPGDPGSTTEAEGEEGADDESLRRAVAWLESWTPEAPVAESHFLRWEGPETWRSWQTDPAAYDVDAPEPSTESFVGGRRVYRCGDRTHVVYGPWQVVIRGLKAYRRKAVLARWEIHRSWITEEGREVWSRLPVEGDLMAGSSATLGRGASERRWLGESETRLGGSSRLLWMGASERRLGGASERAFQSASEWLMRGASGRRFRGASEQRLGGASERRLGGASEPPRRPDDGIGFPPVDDDSEQGD